MRILTYARRAGRGWPIRFWFKDRAEFAAAVLWLAVGASFVCIAIVILTPRS